MDTAPETPVLASAVADHRAVPLARLARDQRATTPGSLRHVLPEDTAADAGRVSTASFTSSL